MDKKNILTYQGLKKLEDELQELKAVSYTHLDVYKRQLQVWQNLLLRSEKRIKHENEAAAGKYSVAARPIL